MANNIILYSSNCPRCKVIESKLKTNSMNYIVNSDTNEMRSKGFTEVPMIQLPDGTILNFHEAIIWLRDPNNIAACKQQQLEIASDEVLANEIIEVNEE